MQQPIARPLHVGPAVRHPFQFVVALEEVEIAYAARVVTLRSAERWPHYYEQHLDTIRLQRARQLQRISPDTSNSVRRHQYSFDAHNFRIIQPRMTRINTDLYPCYPCHPWLNR